MIIEQVLKVGKKVLTHAPQKAHIGSACESLGLEMKKLVGDVVQINGKSKTLIRDINHTGNFVSRNTFISRRLEQLSKLFPSIKSLNVLRKKSYLSANGFTKLKYSHVKNFLKENPNIDIEDFCNYANSVDYNALQEIVPEIKNFKSINRFYFANHHYPKRKLNFNIEDFKFGEDLTQYLKENYVTSDSMLKLYSTYPTLKREVGTLSNDWIKLINNSNQNREKRIMECIDNFRESGKTKIFADELGNIFGQPVIVKKIGSGAHSKVYKITTAESKDICLKIFKHSNFHTNIHGANIEVQNALFANSHCDDFVKFYFGRVGVPGKQDGFMVTQFLKKGVEPEVSEISKNAKSYTIKLFDCHEGNYRDINGKRYYIDFGGMGVIDNSSKKIISDI